VTTLPKKEILDFTFKIFPTDFCEVPREGGPEKKSFSEKNFVRRGKSSPSAREILSHKASAREILSHKFLNFLK